MARTPLTLPVSGRKFRAVRELAGLEQKQVETLTTQRGYRVHRTRVSRIETGEVKPTAAQLTALLELYRVPLADVLDVTP
jgi:transcriptional regulator with XRE-family HTH domain